MLTTAPENYKQAGMFMMISGILNVIFGLLGTISICIGGLFCIVGWLLVFIPLIAVGCGVFEILNGLKAKNGEHVPALKTVAIIGIVVGVFCGNIIGAVLEILAIVNLGKEDAVAFLNGES